MSTLYLYGIIPTPQHHQFDLSDPDTTGPHHRVYLLPYGQVAAVVSDSPLSSYDGLTREQVLPHLMRHQRVVEKVMGEHPILPVKFGTFLPDEMAIQRLLIQHEAVFATLLEQIAHRIQMEVVVLWNLEQVFAEIGQSPRLRQLKAEMTTLSGEALQAKQIEAGQQVKTLLEERRETLQAQILPQLQAVAEQHVLNPLMDDSMVLNTALLLTPAQEDTLDLTLLSLDEQFEEQLMFRCVGPLPVHSFATLTVRTFNPEAIEAARQTLELGIAATPIEIKKAYHRLAAAHHPDHQPEDTAADTVMASLSAAYNLLSQYARHHVLGATQASLCYFDRESVAHAVRVEIETELVPSGA